MSVPEEETLDKKQIEAEEKEAMLREDKVEAAMETTAEVRSGQLDVVDQGREGPVRAALATDEGREVKPKYIPIGGIKMPGFFTRSSDKSKEVPGEECVTVEAEGGKEEEKKHKRRRLLFTCPFTRFLHHPERRPADGTSGSEEPSAKKRILESVRLSERLASVGDCWRRAEGGEDPEAALASTETLDDKPELPTPADGMETVKLDGSDEPEGSQVVTKLPWRERIRQKKFIIDDLVVAGLALLVVLVVVIVSVAMASVGPPAERPLREGMFITTLTSCGPIEGVLKNGAYNFYGIPYAVPPIGEKRFTYAQSLNNITTCWNGTLYVQKAAPVCLQMLENGTIVGEEDCLTLDVVTPHVRYDSPLPVVVLIGANSLVGGISPLQPSPRYARSREVVFVRPNFRLGALGFLALEVLSKTKYPETSGNYGLSDLIVALEWVQHNIKHFGGDPASVTLLGHRAGATLASIITTVKRAKKLYTRAWLTSGSVIFPGEPLQEDEKKNLNFLEMSKCDSAECLRRITTTQILQATPDVWLPNNQARLPSVGEIHHSWLVKDGDLIREHPYEVWQAEKTALTNSGKESDNIIFGSTEHSAHSDLLHKLHLDWTVDIIEELVKESALANISSEVFQHYNKTYEGLLGVISAVRSVCPLVSMARLRLDVPLYVVSAAGAGGGYGVQPRVATINADVEAILGTFESNTPEQRRFVTAMQDNFYYFVANGHLPAPNAPLTNMAQDPLPISSLPICDTLIKNDMVPRYAHVD